MMHGTTSSSTLSPSSTVTPSPTRRNASSSNQLREILGGLIGGVSLLVLVSFAVWVVQTRRRNSKANRDTFQPTPFSGGARPERDGVNIEPFLEAARANGIHLHSGYYLSADMETYRPSPFNEGHTCSI